MTEDEWLACDDPVPLVAAVWSSVTPRKARRFLVACCRQCWGNAADGPAELALAVADRMAETGDDLHKSMVFAAPGRALIDCGATPNFSLTRTAGVTEPVPIPEAALRASFVAVLESIACYQLNDRSVSWQRDRFAAAGLPPARQAALFRDVVRGAYRPLHIRLEWARNGDAAAVARSADESQSADGLLDTDTLAVLADALEDAGCDAGELLAHLRSGGPHVRGCWALDAVLGLA